MQEIAKGMKIAAIPEIEEAPDLSVRGFITLARILSDEDNLRTTYRVNGELILRRQVHRMDEDSMCSKPADIKNILAHLTR